MAGTDEPMNKKTIVLACILSLAFGGLAVGQGASETFGTIVDREGNPVPDVKVSFVPQGNPTLVYSGKSNKKGRYFVQGLFTPKERDMWDIMVEAEGWVPINLFVESRNVNRVLIGDFETKLPYGTKIPEISIRPLGKARVDFVMAPEEEISLEFQEAQQAAAAAAAAAAGGEVGEGGEAVLQRNPWAEALTLAQDGDYRAAVPLFEEAVAAEPEDVERLDAYAKVLFELERFEESESAARRILELDPENIDGRKVLSSAQLGGGDLEGAKTTIEEGLAMAPDSIELYERLAYVAVEMGDDAAGIAAYEKITEIRPSNSNAWMDLGALYAATGDTVKSEQAYQKVADLNPADAYQTFYNIGALIMKRDGRSDSDTQRAIDAFRKAVEIKPDYGQAYQELAFALLGTGDRPGALDALEEFVKIAPGSAESARMKPLIDTLKKTP
jgi:tetratricopeptide (TPR) repeat protein